MQITRCGLQSQYESVKVDDKKKKINIYRSTREYPRFERNIVLLLIGMSFFDDVIM